MRFAMYSPTGAETAPSDLAWRVLGLVNLYRLLVSAGILIASRFALTRDILHIDQPTQMVMICGLYFMAGLALIALRRFPAPTLRVLALSHAIVDSVGVGSILWASGGVAGGLGILLLLPIGAMALLASNVDAFFMAAIAAVAVLVQQIISQVSGVADGSSYLMAGVLGAIIFIAALSVRPLANRLLASEALVRRQEVDLENLSQLSQYIVQHLRESILVVDEQDRIRLINESAAGILGDAQSWPGALLGECSPRLLFMLTSWRQNGESSTPGTFAAADGARLIQPYFARLGGARPGPVLVFLEDTSLLAEKVQQSKLASLGRLSASIAHEIRNPVGAMSHAGQLLAESPTIRPEDKRLTQIIRDNADRISRIVENVLDLSRRGSSKPERLDLASWLAEFQEEFCATEQIAADDLKVSAMSGDRIDVHADPSQLRQVLWNLCQNAITHGRTQAGSPVTLRYGLLATNGRPYLEVIDHGPGIAREDVERVFEPFFTKALRGTGLGLFLARELAQTNGATLLHESPPDGGSLFRLVFTDPSRWAA
jgi:two-component system, NtrC family, sensor histidine kinase PilS